MDIGGSYANAARMASSTCASSLGSGIRGLQFSPTRACTTAARPPGTLGPSSARLAAAHTSGGFRPMRIYPQAHLGTRPVKWRRERSYAWIGGAICIALVLAFVSMLVVLARLA